jgi:hypothetical protein
MSNTRWSVINRVGKRGLMNGCWLVSPDGKKVATIIDHADSAISRQIAAAMNLTTTKQRTGAAADAAGYKVRKEGMTG